VRPVGRDSVPFLARVVRIGMNKIVEFFKDSYAELRKVVWPSREDVISSVQVVFISTLVFAGILGLVDFLLLIGVNRLF
jgi:preprotein translocase subunit SecE